MADKLDIKVCTAELKEILSITDNNVMEYAVEMEKLKAFAEKCSNDERAGVKKLVERANKKYDSLADEIERVKKLMLFENIDHDIEFICGVDEVGRGPFAGPILSAAVILPKDLIIPFINDSKQVSKARREALYDVIMDKAVAIGIGMCTNTQIDEMGIQPANYKAMTDAINNLKSPKDGTPYKPGLALIDCMKLPNLDIRQKNIVHGDANSISIGAASIIAKVTRDRMMEDYDVIYPGYGFAHNAGYGSKEHIEKLKKDGPCEIHRRSFIKNYV